MCARADSGILRHLLSRSSLVAIEGFAARDSGTPKGHNAEAAMHLPSQLGFDFGRLLTLIAKCLNAAQPDGRPQVERCAIRAGFAGRSNRQEERTSQWLVAGHRKRQFFVVAIATQPFAKNWQRHIGIPSVGRREEVVSQVQRQRRRQAGQPQIAIVARDSGKRDSRLVETDLGLCQRVTESKPEWGLTETIAAAEDTTTCANRIAKTCIAWVAIATQTKEIQIDIGVGDGRSRAQSAVKPCSEVSCKEPARSVSVAAPPMAAMFGRVLRCCGVDVCRSINTSAAAAP